MKQVILITGASSGFGLLTARALAEAGHTVYASMRDLAGTNAGRSQEVLAEAKERGIDLRTVELDVTSEASAESAISTVMARDGRLDVLIHNAGHMVFGPAEAFTAEQYARLYDVNVLGTQRVNRAALPVMRKQGRGLLVWVSSSSTRGGTPPYPGAVLCRQGCHGFAGRNLRGRTDPLGHRDVDHGAGGLHQGNQPFPPCWQAG